MSTAAALEPISADLLPPLRGLAADLESMLPGTRTIVESSSSVSFPLTLFLIVTSADAEDTEDLAFEITFKPKDKLTAVSIELVSEAGDLLGPTLVSRFSSEEINTGLADVEWRLQRDVMKYVYGYTDVLESWFNVLESRRATLDVDTVLKRRNATHQAAERSFKHLASLMGTEFGVELASRSVPLRGNRAASFDFVSNDGTIVGELKRYRSARGSLESLTAAIWRVQQALGADRRFVLLAPDHEKALRWVAKYGVEALDRVELWGVGKAAGSVARLA